MITLLDFPWLRARVRVPDWFRWNFLSPMLLFVPEGEMKPTLYGFAWRDYMRPGTIAMPVPLNIVGRWVRHVWQWLRCVPYGYRGTLLDRATGDGWLAGRSSRSREVDRLHDRVAELVTENHQLHEQNRVLRHQAHVVDETLRELGAKYGIDV